VDYEPFKKLGGRRFLLSVGCNLVTSALLYLGKLDGGSYTAITIATVGAYIAGDTMQGISKQKLAAENPQ
jgi:hypothetical protein